MEISQRNFFLSFFRFDRAAIHPTPMVFDEQKDVLPIDSTKINIEGCSKASRESSHRVKLMSQLKCTLKILLWHSIKRVRLAEFNCLFHV